MMTVISGRSSALRTLGGVFWRRRFLSGVRQRHLAKRKGVFRTGIDIKEHSYLPAFVARCAIALMITSNFDTVLAFAQPTTDRPHYELALNAEINICQNILSVYNNLLNHAVSNSEHSPSTGNGVLTDFAAENPRAFEKIGLSTPHQTEEIPPVEFYSIRVGSRQTAQVLAKEDLFQGRSPNTALAIFKEGASPRLGDGQDAFADPPVRKSDVEWLITVGDLASSQELSAQFPNNYLLKKWPGFSRLMSRYKIDGSFASLPSIGGGVGVTITPFIDKKQSTFLIYDQYMSIRNARELRGNSEDAGIVVVQRLEEMGPDDVCYLVLAPGKLSATVESK